MRRIWIEVNVGDQAPTDQMMGRIRDWGGANPTADP